MRVIKALLLSLVIIFSAHPVFAGAVVHNLNSQMSGNITYETEVLSETFDHPPSPVIIEGQEIHGWNGWRKNEGSPDYILNSEFTLITEPGTNNKVASMRRTSESGLESRLYLIQKFLSIPKGFGRVSIKFKLNSLIEDNKDFVFILETQNP